MQLKNYQAYVHGNGVAGHMDVELMVKGKPTIKMCNCSAYMGGIDSFGDVVQSAAVVREDLASIANSGEDITILQDTLDGSIDIFRARDNALLFSMEAEKIEGAGWVQKYNSVE